MKKILKRCLIGLLIVLGISYAVYQVYLITNNAITTETAIRVTVSNTIEGQGAVFRQETVIEQQRHDTIVYKVDAGAKIAKGSAIAQIYQNSQDAMKQQELDSIYQQIALLESVQSSGGTSHLQADAIQEQILYSIGYLQSSLDKDVFSVSDAADSLLIEILKKNMLSDSSIDLTSMIEELKAEAKQIESGLSGHVETVVTPLAGYFVSTVDGLEEQCSVDKIDEYTADQLLALAGQQNTDSDVIGKVITSYEWYYAAVVDSDKADDLTPGSRVTIGFSFTDVNDIRATVVDIKEDTNGRSIVYVKSTNMSAPISNIRTQDIVIKTQSYTGIRVPIKAVHVVDGVKGVYVLLNHVVHFKELDILYENENYIISVPGASSSNNLRVYDEIIVEGRDLYDGKTV